MGVPPPRPLEGCEIYPKPSTRELPLHRPKERKEQKRPPPPKYTHLRCITDAQGRHFCTPFGSHLPHLHFPKGKGKKKKKKHPEVIGRLDTVNFTFGFLTNSHPNRQDLAPRGVSRRPWPSLSNRRGVQLSAEDPTVGRILPWAGRTLAQRVRSSRRATSGPRRGYNAGFNFPNLQLGPRFLPRCCGLSGDPQAGRHPLQSTGSCTLRPLFPSPPHSPTSKKIQPPVQSRHFDVIYLARLGFRGNILPSRLEVWAAHQCVRGREAGLLGPLAEPVCCHPPNFSTQRARRERQKRGRRGGGGGKDGKVGGEGAGAAR